MQSDLSFEQYAAWCLLQNQQVDHSSGPSSSADTVLADLVDSCPVTVRSRRDGILVTPTPRRSR